MRVQLERMMSVFVTASLMIFASGCVNRGSGAARSLALYDPTRTLDVQSNYDHIRELKGMRMFNLPTSGCTPHTFSMDDERKDYMRLRVTDLNGLWYNDPAYELRLRQERPDGTAVQEWQLIMRNRDPNGLKQFDFEFVFRAGSGFDRFEMGVPVGGLYRLTRTGNRSLSAVIHFHVEDQIVHRGECGSPE